MRKHTCSNSVTHMSIHRAQFTRHLTVQHCILTNEKTIQIWK